jgi:hypothetical protein
VTAIESSIVSPTCAYDGARAVMEMDGGQVTVSVTDPVLLAVALE